MQTSMQPVLSGKYLCQFYVFCIPFPKKVKEFDKKSFKLYINLTLFNIEEERILMNIEIFGGKILEKYFGTRLKNY